MEFRCSSRAKRAALACSVAFLTLIATAGTASAQSDTPPKWDLFAGYQWLHPGGTVPRAASDPSNPISFKLPDEAAGGGAALTYNFDKFWGGEVDFGYNTDTKSDSSEWTLSIGPRFMARTDTANYFLHALVGLNRLSYDSGAANHNGMGIILGGGWIFRFRRSGPGDCSRPTTYGRITISRNLPAPISLRYGAPICKEYGCGPAWSTAGEARNCLRPRRAPCSQPRSW